MTAWRPIESVEDDVSALPDADPQNKRRSSRRRAWRDGLAAQTVVEALEDVRSYRSFERTIIASFFPRSAIELELVHRLASLFWRLRRAAAVETGLLQAQGEIRLGTNERSIPRKTATFPSPREADSHDQPPPAGSAGKDDARISDRGPNVVRTLPGRLPNCRTIAEYFLRLSRLDPTLLDRAGTYEMRLWRQAAQTIWILDAIRRPPPAAPRRSSRKPVPHQFWDRYVKNL
jgi:hypothetical protein